MRALVSQIHSFRFLLKSKDAVDWVRMSDVALRELMLGPS